MDLFSEELKQWLLQSVLGVILLGAIGSIVATVLVYIVRKAIKGLLSSKERLLRQFFYRYLNPILLGEGLRDIYAPHSKETRYIAFVVYETGMFVGLTVMLLLSVALSLLIYVTFALEKPIALSAFIGATIFFSNKTLQHALYITSLLSRETLDVINALQKAHPKTFSEWEKGHSQPKS